MTLELEKADETKNFWVKYYALKIKLTTEDLAKINEALSATTIQGDRYSKALTALANRRNNERINACPAMD